jgi:hypothetical protein
MINTITTNLNGKKILILFVLTNVVYAIMLTITIPAVMNYAGGMKLPDMLPAGYSPEYVHSLLTALGSEGRNAYLFQQMPLDFMYPGLFGISYCLLFAFLLKKLNKLDGVLFYACFVPLFAGLFDYLENIGIITLLIRYPDHSTTLSHLTNVFSILKSSLTTIYFIFFLITLLTLLTKYMIIVNKKTSNR